MTNMDESSLQFLASGFLMGVVSVLAFRYISKKPSNFPLTSNGRYKLMVVVRTDVSMGKGKIAAQCSHAAVACYRIADKRNTEFLAQWLKVGQPKVVARLEKDQGEDDLYKLAQQAQKLGLPSKVIHDAGHTQVASGTATVVGIGPGPIELVDQVTSQLKLL